jgi:ketosteroid isomerase-like protein
VELRPSSPACEALAALALALLSGCAPHEARVAQAPATVVVAETEPPACADVRALLDAQVSAWNRFDLDAFLSGYRKDEHVVFVTPEGSSRGFAELERRYRASYDAPEKFGRLAFEDVHCTLVDPASALVQGSWRLARKADSPHGRFVLVVCRLPEGWRIVSDYTTAGSTGG